jgi:Xaa-Pro aminopeptidase
LRRVADIHRQRLARLVGQLGEARVDAILVSGIANIRYLSGFTGSNALLLVTGSDQTLITDPRYATQVTEEVTSGIQILVDNESLWKGLFRAMARQGALRVVAFEGAHISFRDHERLLEGGARWQWRSLEDLVESLRHSKDLGELELITAAAEIATSALDVFVGQVRAGMTELQMAGVLEKALRDAGSEGFPFPTIIASGPRSALPHARTSDRVVKQGDLILVDFGAVYRGYCSDITRTFVAGTAGQREREVHRVVRQANENAAVGIRAGMKGKDADLIARSHIERAGFGPHFGHGLGHGIGLEVHEAPRLSHRVEASLPPAAVVTVEPGIYIPGWGGVRIEDDVYLSSDGPKILTRFTRELVELK